MAEADDDTPIGSFKPLVAPGSDRPPAVALPGDNAPIGSFKPILSTSYQKVPSKENGDGSLWDTFTHNLGVGTRNVIEGVSALPGQIADVATYPGRVINTALGIDRGTRPSELINKGLDATGLPAAQTPEEQRNAEMIRGGAAMLTPLGLALGAPRLAAQLPAVVRPLVAPEGPITAPAAATQVAAGGAGAATGEALANSEYVPDWLKPTARLAGNIIGAGGTSGVKSASETLINMAKGVPSDIAAALARLGIKPGTVGAVTTQPGVQATEGSVSRLPAATGTLKPAQQQTLDQFGNAVERTAQRISPAATGQEAGDVVTDALRKWKETTNVAEQDAAWNPLSQRLAGAAVDPSGYRAALERAARDPALNSLPNIQKEFAQKQIQGWLDALNTDVPPGQNMSWEQAMALKRRIGDQLGTPDIVNSMGDNALKNIYGSLADDMKATATQHGQANLFDAANAVTIRNHQFIEGTMSKAVQKNNPEQETVGADTVAQRMVGDNQAMQQLRDRVPEAADALAAWQLRQMKMATGSKQGATADSTSTESFLTRMANQRLQKPEGSAALYAPVQGHVNDLMTVAEQLRNVEQNVNRSGSGATVQLASLGPQIWQAYEAGGWKAVLGTAAFNYLGPKVTAQVLASRPAIAYASARPGTGTPLGALGGLWSDQATQGDMPTITVKPRPEDRQ